MEVVIDAEVAQGWRHFRCDVCDIDYQYRDLGVTTKQLMCFQGRYQECMIEICVECVEYIGGDYDG
jgi:hypothetical protein